MRTNIEKLDKYNFKILFDKYFKELTHFLYYKSGDEELAEDIVQDVFFILWERRDSVRMETVRPFLYRLATNFFVDRQRRFKIEYNFQNNLVNKVSIESPEFLLEYKELIINYQNVLASLSDKQRTVFLMNRIDGLSYKEIAESLNISTTAVEKRMKLALQSIKTAMQLKV